MSGPEFELALAKTQYDDAVKALVAAKGLAARYQDERDHALAAGRAVEEQLDRANAAITRVLLIVADPNAALVADRVRAALKEPS